MMPEEYDVGFVVSQLRSDEIGVGEEGFLAG
jgi:hypothetical protein